MPTENENYVFISYAHANSDKVLPIITALRNNGIRAWYDEGIVAGSEWPEFIAEKVVNCTAFVLFVSDAYLVSQNCKRELNFAISRKKQILSIFLENVQLSPGVEMQLGTYQAIYRNRFPNDQAFYNSVCQEPFFDICRTATDTQQSAPSPVVHQATPVQPVATPNATSSATANATPAQPANNYADSLSSITDKFEEVVPVDAIADKLKESQPVAAISDKLKETNLSKNLTDFSHKKKSKLVAAILAFFTGCFGGHFFYLGRYGLGIVCLLLSLIKLAWIPFIWGIIQGIRYLMCPDETFQKTFGKQ